MVTATLAANPLTPVEVSAERLMSTPVATVSGSESVMAAWLLLSRHHVHHLVVVDEDRRCLGVVDDRMLAAHWPPSPRAALEATVGQYMSGPTVCVLPTASAARVARTMCSADVDAVPVVDAGGHVLGVVTARDLLRLVAESGLGEPT